MACVDDYAAGPEALRPGPAGAPCDSLTSWLGGFLDLAVAEMGVAQRHARVSQDARRSAGGAGLRVVVRRNAAVAAERLHTAIMGAGRVPANTDLRARMATAAYSISAAMLSAIRAAASCTDSRARCA